MKNGVKLKIAKDISASILKHTEGCMFEDSGLSAKDQTDILRLIHLLGGAISGNTEASVAAIVAKHS